MANKIKICVCGHNTGKHKLIWTRGACKEECWCMMYKQKEKEVPSYRDDWDAIDACNKLIDQQLLRLERIME